MNKHSALLIGLALIGCDPAVESDLDGGTSGGPQATTTSTPHPTTGPSSTTTPDPTADPDPTTQGTSTGVVDPSTSSTGPDFEGSSSSSESSSGSDSSSSTTGGEPGEPCDSYEQDCPDGEKCNPWASDGGPQWNALGCFPIDPEPGQPGDPCTVENSGTSGFDSCDLGSMCWDVDSGTGEGICIGLCQGSADMPTCAEPGTSCTISNGGVLNLCLPGCDPLAQDCGAGQGCYPSGGAFVCAPDASGGTIPGDTCEFINACSAGQGCISANAYGPECAGAACCSPFCDIQDGTCPEAGQACLAWFQEGASPPGLDTVGICVDTLG